jgi:hypothetical protein
VQFVYCNIKKILIYSIHKVKEIPKPPTQKNLKKIKKSVDKQKKI